MSPAAPRCPVARLRVARRTYAIVDTELLAELNEGPAWSVWRNKGRLFVGRWIYDRQTRRRRLETLAGYVCREREWACRIVPIDGDYLNCTRVNLRVVERSISRLPSLRNPYEVRFVVNGKRHVAGRWPSLELARAIRDDVAPIVELARAEKWNRRELREAIDRAVCNIRDRKRTVRKTVGTQPARPKLSKKESYD